MTEADKQDWKARFRAWGAEGGKKRMSALTPKQRKALAKKAGSAPRKRRGAKRTTGVLEKL